MSFVDGVIIMGNKTFVYRQDEKSVGKSFPDQSFTAKDGEIVKVEYNSIQKKLSMVVKIGSQNGKDSKKDFQFYPPEALWLTGSTSYGTLRQIDCQRCSEILSVLVKASNEFVRQEKMPTLPSR